MSGAVLLKPASFCNSYKRVRQLLRCYLNNRLRAAFSRKTVEYIISRSFFYFII